MVWDVDGNKYVDLVSSLASVTLGYSDSQISKAVAAQLKRGVIYSLPGRLEAEVAEMICGLVPCAEMVRFGKNGSDATAAAVRLARAYTGKSKVLVCGYHGWQDWYIGSTSRNKGVPAEVSALTLSFAYNDIEVLKRLVSAGEVACIVMEPMNIEFPKPGYLQEIREIASDNGVILIFDETITGFRFCAGGAQELFGVIPDLATFGKGIANGFPLSAVVGKREIMMEMENIFFSGTFGGELLSLAAAKAVLKLHQENLVAPELARIGSELNESLLRLVREYSLEDYLSTSGHDSWKFLNWSAPDQALIPKLKTLFLQEMFKNGVIVLSTHNVNLAMKEKQLKLISQAQRKALEVISIAINESRVEELLECTPLEPLFKVR
jgi:glutamate-1-semialdehyde 2,1-aminomutase